MPSEIPTWFKQLSWSPTRSVGSMKRSDIPSISGCYALTSRNRALLENNVLYVDKTTNLRNRVWGYLNDYMNVKPTSHKGRGFIFEYRDKYGDENLYARWTIFGGNIDHLEANLIWYLNPELNDRYEQGELWDDTELLDPKLLL